MRDSLDATTSHSFVPSNRVAIKYLPVFGEVTGNALLSECGVIEVLHVTLQLPLISEFFLDTRKNSSWKRGVQAKWKRRNKHAMIV